MIQLFVVFHKYIFDDCYKNIPNDILYKYFTFIAVNEKIPKAYTQNKYKVINEWELPHYDPTFQQRGYNENSVIYHVYSNNLHKNYKYVGFFQYDMMFNNNIVEYLLANISENPVYFNLGTRDFNFCKESWCQGKEENTLNFIINDYEQFFKTLFDESLQYPLWNTYVVPLENYDRIMRWVTQLYKKLYPWCIEPPNSTHPTHIGSIFERIMAYAIANEKLPTLPMNISHEYFFKSRSY